MTPPYGIDYTILEMPFRRGIVSIAANIVSLLILITREIIEAARDRD